MELKAEVLRLLEHNREAFLSGEQLAKQLHVSRNAVWKAVGALKRDGYTILSATNRGYRLSDTCDKLSEEAIRMHLKPAYQTLPLFVYPCLESTNITAKKLAADSAIHGTTVLAEQQTQGRGRLGRSFYSPAEQGVYMSVVLRPNADLSNAALITTAASVAVARAVEHISGKDVQIKWVNDIFLDGKKICGILTEAVTSCETGQIESVVVGIGINVKKVEFPADIAPVAGSLNLAQAVRSRLAAQVLNELLELCEDLESRSFLPDYRKRSMVIGKELVFIRREQRFYGKAIDLDPDGGLVVRLEDGTVETLRSGEITVRGRTT